MTSEALFPILLYAIAGTIAGMGFYAHGYGMLRSVRYGLLWPIILLIGACWVVWYLFGSDG